MKALRALIASGVVVVASSMAACAAPAAEVAPGTAVAGAASGLTPRGDTLSGVRVDRVVDGDTLHVTVEGNDVTVRLIGINTPETVKPDSPVECFGPESSEFAKRTLSGRTVTLEFDASQGMTDQYDRTLAYVWLEEPGGALSLFNLQLVAGGFAYERQYGSVPYSWKGEFDAAEETARATEAGLWGACPSG